MDDKEITEVDDKIRPQEDRHSRATYLSFGSYQIFWTVIVATLNLFLFFYYHAVIGLEPWLILLATVMVLTSVPVTGSPILSPTS